MRGYNKNYVKCFLLIEPLTPLTSRSALTKNIEVGMPRAAGREIFELRHSLMAEGQKDLSS